MFWVRLAIAVVIFILSNWPLMRVRSQEFGKAVVGGKTSPEGTEIHVDLPGEYHRHNVSSRGSGCCVFTSIGHSARWQDVPVLIDFQTWIQSKGLPGGGYPGNVKDRITKICREKGVPEPPYLQVEGDDLDILKLACASGRMPAVTYSYSPTGRYGGRRIAHMVSLPHIDSSYAAVLDNNYPGIDKYEWLDVDTFRKVYRPGWAVILLSHGPPPVPRN